MRTKVKICGLRRKEDIELINRLPVSYGGFIFAKQSKRYIPPEKAAKLIALLRKDIIPVGVFLDTPIEEVNQIAQIVGIRLIQLHGGEKDQDCRKAIRPVWKSVGVSSQESVEQWRQYPSAAGILLDTGGKAQKGGTGQTFCWQWAKDLPCQCFTILAGGITPENAAQAIFQVRPQVLDVNSGIETDGFKDRRKAEALFRRLEYEI